MTADNDVWMHARQFPGSHLVMRIPAGSRPEQEDIQYAANLSVFFSKARGNGKCDVTMCSGKDVTKPKGAKPGQVLVRSEKVVSGYPDRSAAALSDKSR
jgi:predicted ribosome quality control (RQC) complex YloA/Tae2 family protein